MKIIKIILNKVLDFVFFNRLNYTFFNFYEMFIHPRVEKTRGIIVCKKIKNKGIDLRIHGKVTIINPNMVKIGNYVRIGTGAFFSCAGGLSIGDNTQFSRNVTIYTNNHDIEGISIPYDNKIVCKSVNIGRSVWIGMNVTITPGVSIEDGAIIGMGTVVSKDVPKGAIVVGARQRIIGYRDLEDFAKKDLDKKYFGLLFPNN